MLTLYPGTWVYNYVVPLVILGLAVVLFWALARFTQFNKEG